jgi:glycyl-tRNA synthetase
MTQKKNQQTNMDDIVALCKRRGIVYPGSDIYGGLANSWDFGPLGVELKRNIKQSWWNAFVHQREDMYGLDAAIIMNPKVWEASGHKKGFSDVLVECKNCHTRFRLDELGGSYDEEEKSNGNAKISFDFGEKNCPSCNKFEWTTPKQFNLMLGTHLGAESPINTLFNAFLDFSEEKIKKEDVSKLFEREADTTAYLRPETAQGIFVNFKNIVDSMSPKLPFGIAQIGKAFRNEITPGNFIFRTREFEQMEIEYFVREQDWEQHFNAWNKTLRTWVRNIGVQDALVHEFNVPKDELAHYSKRTIDVEFDFPFGKDELYGLAYRTDFDLSAHKAASGARLEYTDSSTGEKFVPHVIEPSMGVERMLLAVLTSAYKKDDDRVWLDLPFAIAPYKAAVFPLVKNKPDIVAKAREVYDLLRSVGIGTIAWDERGNVGKRYYAQDEIGTPYGITVDYDSLEDGAVTVRDRNTTKQERVSVDELVDYIRNHS